MMKWCNGEIKFSVIFYQIIRKRSCQITKQIRKIYLDVKKNNPITSTFGQIINLSNSSQNFKSVQILWPCLLSLIFLIMSCSTFSIIKFKKQDSPYNGGGDARPLQTRSEFSSLQCLFQTKTVLYPERNPGNFQTNSS